MRLVSDDDIKRIDRRYLGPKGKLLPIRTTYRNWGIMITAVVMVLFVWLYLGLPVNQWSITIGAFLTVWVTIIVQRYLVDEVTIFSSIKMLANEARSPHEEHLGKPEHIFLAMSIPTFSSDMPSVTTKLQQRRLEADQKYDQKLKERLDKTRYSPYLDI